MLERKEDAKYCLAHDRAISIHTYMLGDQVILIKGVLRDHRHRRRESEVMTQPKLVHHMVARLKIRGPQLEIIEAEAQMPRYPRQGCDEVLSGISRLVGERIKGGFSLRVKELIGNSRGCAHLTNLILAMGPAAVQGYWASYGADRSKISLEDERVKLFVDTCYLWRKGGPLMESLRQKMDG